MHAFLGGCFDIGRVVEGVVMGVEGVSLVWGCFVCVWGEGEGTI